MSEFWNTAGTIMTQFLMGLTKVWDWLINTEIPVVNLPVISVFGAGFIVLISYSIIRSLTI